MDGAPERERQLIERLQRGDPTALGELYDIHAARMLALGVRLLKQRKEAEDLLHDVFLQAWEHARDYDPARGTVRAWLMMRMRSRALDRLGSAGFARGAPLSEAPERADHQNRAADDLEALAVRTALSGMPEDVRRVLHWTYFLGMKAHEIASQEDMPEGTVRSRLARGLAMLEARLKERDP